MAQQPKVSLNSSRPLRAFPREGTFIDESPALTAVLQAQRAAIVAAPLCSEAKQRAAGVAVGAAAVRERLIDRSLKPGDLRDRVVGAPGVHRAVRLRARVAFVRCAVGV